MVSKAATLFKNKRFVIALYIIGLCLISIIIGLTLPILRDYRGNIDFQTYEPKTLPADLTVSGRQVNVIQSKESSILPNYETFVTIEFTPQGNHILEEKNTAPLPGCDNIAINQTCVVAKTPDGQSYQLVGLRESDKSEKIVNYTATFKKSDTIILIDLSGNVAAKLTQKDWGIFIDSFEPVTYKDLPVVHIKSGP